jgi:hypothetical protein
MVLMDRVGMVLMDRHAVFAAVRSSCPRPNPLVAFLAAQVLPSHLLLEMALGVAWHQQHHHVESAEVEKSLS